MPHVRATIRNAVVAALIAANTAAGTRVYAHRVDPLDAAKLPALTVEAMDEDIQIEVQGRPAIVVQRNLRLRVTACVKTTPDDLDNLLAQVETCMANSQSIGGAKIIEIGSLRGDVSGDLQRPLYQGSQAFLVTYYTSQANPGAAL